MKGLDGSNSPLSAIESGCCGNLRETVRNGRVCGPFLSAQPNQRGTNIDVIRRCASFLSARAQVGSVSQLLRPNAAGTRVADVTDIDRT